jgi:pimeloyl-ACP methyl ester carboxylesterase
MSQVLNGLNQVLRRYLVARGVASVTTTVRQMAMHHYLHTGTGPHGPAVLLHGLASSANGFYRVILPLSRVFSRVFAVDLPGSGYSPPPAEGVSVERQYEGLVAFIQDVVREPVVLIGNSLGGAMAVKFAYEHPEWVKQLILIAPAGARLTEARMRELIETLTVATTQQARALTRRLFHQTPLVALLFASELRKQYNAQTVKAFLEVAATLEPLSETMLASVRAPTLLLWGKSEKLLPHEMLDYFRTHLPPSSEIHVVDRFGHIPQVERPGEVVRHVEDFLDRTRQAAKQGSYVSG